MLDIKFIRENPQLVQKAATDKNFKVDIDKLLTLDKNLRAIVGELESLQADRNRISKQIPKASPEERESLKAEVSSFKGKMDELGKSKSEVEAELNQLMLLVPQPAREDVPVGKDDTDNVEMKTWGTIPEFDFKPKPHWELAQKLGMVDFEGGVKLAGSRSYLLKKDGVLLQQAVMRFVFDFLLGKGYEPMYVPVLVNDKVMEGTGYFPLGRDQAYCAEKDEMALVGTSEVSLCGYHDGDLLKEADLPLRYFAQSTCFRREAGTYGKDTKGFYRVHQFEKIEQVIIAPADKDMSEELHNELLGNAESVMQALNLPYRVVYVCSGDLGQGQVRKHDIEAWMPSRDSWGETHSCSTFYDFQARRLRIRYKNNEGKNVIAYTLNNTAIAAPRILIPLIENNQVADGKVKIPKVLQPYMGGREFIG